MSIFSKNWSHKYHSRETIVNIWLAPWTLDIGHWLLFSVPHPFGNTTKSISFPWGEMLPTLLLLWNDSQLAAPWRTGGWTSSFVLHVTSSVKVHCNSDQKYSFCTCVLRTQLQWSIKNIWEYLHIYISTRPGKGKKKWCREDSRYNMRWDWGEREVGLRCSLGGQGEKRTMDFV